MKAPFIITLLNNEPILALFGHGELLNKDRWRGLWGKPRMLLSGRTVLYLHGDGRENNGCKLTLSKQTDKVWATSPLQLHQCVWFQFSAIPLGKKNKKKFLNVCFKRLIKHIPGVWLLLFVVRRSALLFQDFCITKKKKKKRKKKTV